MYIQYIPRNMRTLLYNHNKAQQSKNRVHISWDILYVRVCFNMDTYGFMYAQDKCYGMHEND